MARISSQAADLVQPLFPFLLFYFCKEKKIVSFQQSNS